jgi:thioredoxin-related protein
MKKVVVFLFIGVAIFVTLASTTKHKGKVEWITLEALKEQYAKNPKPIVVDLYTDWCGWCKVMDKDTYTNENVTKYIGQNYYAIKFNAESKDSVEFNGKKYGYNAKNRAHDLAVYFAYGQMSYPTTVFLSAINAQPAPLPGFLKPKEIEPYLKFFGDGAYKTMNFPSFMKAFSSKW